MKRGIGYKLGDLFIFLLNKEGSLLAILVIIGIVYIMVQG